MTDDPRAVPVCDDEDLWALCSAMCDGTIDEPRLARLERLMETDPASRQFCALYLRMNGQLMRVFRPIVQRAQWEGEPLAVCDVDQTSRCHSPLPVVAAPLLASRFLSGWPVAYLIATVIFGIGLLAGSVLHVSHSPKVVKRPAPSSVTPGPANGTEYVGRITGMLDCRWADSAQGAFNGAYISLGRKYELLSGYIEITYDSGAKVVLQGPATYEVEASAGGFLSGGRLTAKLEKKGEGRGAGGEGSANHGDRNQSQNALTLALSRRERGPAFVIRTPAAIVTDLGTEFGVEVCDGGTSVHTFRGLVEVQLVQNGDRSDKRIRLGEKESVRILKPHDQTTVKVVRDKVDPAVFVRAEQLPALAREQVLKPLRRWQAYSERLRKDPALVAYYTFEAPGQGDVKVLPNVSAAGSALDGRVEGAEWVLGRLPGKYALLFHGPGSGDKVRLPEQDRFNFQGAFSIAVWFKVSQFMGLHEGIVTKGDGQWRFQQSSERDELVFGTNYGPKDVHRLPGRTRVNDNRWHLGIAVYEPTGKAARHRLYLDGSLNAENGSSLPLQSTDRPVWLGANCDMTERELRGWIDEVAVFRRALSAEEAAAMFKEGSPGKQDYPTVK